MREQSRTNCAARIASRIGLLVVVALAGCAGASVSPQTSSLPIASSRPNAIYVYDFAVTPGDVTLNQGFFQSTYRDATGENQEQSRLQTAHETAEALSNALVEELQGLGFVVTRVPRGTRVSGPNVLVVDGELVDINEGNRLRRMVIGLGAGQATLDTQVQVYQSAGGTPRQLMDFTTHADSGKMPGAAITGPPGAVAGGATAAASLGVNVAAAGVKTYRSTTGFLAKSTADKAVAHMSQYFAAQGWIPQGMAKAGSSAR